MNKAALNLEFATMETMRAQCETRAAVHAIEVVTKQHKQIEIPVLHHFSFGLYGREIFIPKGAMITGHIHKFPQMNVLLKGEISVLIGNKVERLTAPAVICSPSGTKRVAYAHRDTIWLTVHVTHETNIDRIEETFIAHTEEEYSAFLAATAPEGLKCLG